MRALSIYIMLTVYKFPIDYPVEVPLSAALLKVQLQNDHTMAWYCVDTDEKQYRVDTYYSIGTGWDLADYGDVDYVDTLFNEDGFVWHIYKKVT